MCVIIHKNVGKDIPFDALLLAAQRNAHGWGVMTADRGELVTFRGLHTEDASKAAGKHAEEVAKALEQCTDLPTMVHFRYATAGNKSVDNCHPFELLTLNENGIDLSLMHNGTMSQFKSSVLSESDTLRFVREIGAPLLVRSWQYAQTLDGDAVNNLLSDPWLIRVLKDYANSTVFTLLSGTGQALRINPEGGKHYEWGWASNQTQLEPTKTANSNNVSVYRGHFDGDSFRTKDTSTKHLPVVPWTPPEDWKVKPPVGTKRKTLAEQAEELRLMIKHSPQSRCVLPQLGPRLTASDFLDPTMELEDLAYLEFEDIRDLILDCPEAAAACFMDMMEMLFVDKQGKVKYGTRDQPTTPQQGALL